MGKRRLSAAEVFDEVEVDLWGEVFRLREITRSVSERIDTASKQAEEVGDEASGDEAAAALITVIDVLLEPVNADGVTAGELLRARWEDDTLGLDRLAAFAESMQEEAGARRRPTSAMKSAA